MSALYHLTLTDGKPLCGCDKSAEIARGSAFHRAVHAPKFVLESNLLCPRCKQVLDYSEIKKEKK